MTIPNGVTAQVYCDGINFFSSQTGSAGNFTVNGTLSATGVTNTGNMGVGGNLGVTGTLGVTGDTSLTTGSISGVMTAPTAAAGTNTTQLATTAFVQTSLPSGVILLWSGSIATIPSGWLLCDGTSGTPNLRNRFVVGAGSTYAVAATGGTADAVVVSHTHTATVADPGHTHSLNNVFYQSSPNAFTGSGGAGGTINATGSNTTGISVSNSTTGVSGTNQNLPPYYALAYIMKA